MTITDSLGRDLTFKDDRIHKKSDRKIDAAVRKHKYQKSIIVIKRKVKMVHTFEIELLPGYVSWLN